MSSANTFVKTFLVRREMRERVKNESGAVYYRPNGFLIGNAFVSVDFEAIAKELGPKALGNKSRKSCGLKGAIIVTVRDERKEAEAA